MLNNVLVSVLIPAYNHEKYVRETIKSIINQTYKNIELIVLDDGSKDNTWAKIQEMKSECEARFSNVIFETKENEGTCKTFNKLLDMANGEYVYIIASDDLAKPQAIEKEIKFLWKNPEYSLAVGDNEFIDTEGNLCYWDKNQNTVYEKDKAVYKTFGEFLQSNCDFDFNSEKFGTYETLYIKNYIPNGYLIRKEIFNKTGNYTPEAPLEDYWLMLQISKYSKIKYLNEILFSYRWHSNNTIVKNHDKVVGYELKTRAYEERILKTLQNNKRFEKIYKKGVCYKKKGIPFVFEILTYSKNDKKIKVAKILGIEIELYKKDK